MTEKGLKIKNQRGIVKVHPNLLKQELAERETDPYYTQAKIRRYEQRIRDSYCSETRKT